MSGNFSLAQSLIAGMGQRPPQGGLAQAGGAPPQAMAKQGTDMALAAQNREEVLEPGLDAASNMGYQQYAQKLMQTLTASLPSADAMRRAQAARGLMMQNVMETLQPRERSGMDTLAAGISSYDKPVMQGDMGAALAAMGRGAVASKKQFEDEEQKKALAAYSLMDKEMDQQQKLMADALGRQKLLTGGATPEFTLPDGTPVYKSGTRLVYIGKDGKPVEWLGAEKTVIGGDTLLGRHAALVEMLTKEYLERGEYKTLEEATQAAKREADRLMAGVQQQQGVGQRPPTPAAGTPSAKATPAEGFEIDASSPEAFDMLRSKIAERSKAGDRQAVTALQTEMQKQFPNGRPVTAPTDMPKKSARLSEGEKGYGGKEGEALFKERGELSESYKANSVLSSQLDLLEKLYSDPNIPEGQLGPAIQQIRSGLKSLGVEVGDEVNAADLANAIAQKMVLGIRTADGTNLLPGAVSNFEVQLLQSMGPTLSMTNEGRRALIHHMKEVLRSQQRLAEEATRFEAQHGRLTPEWYKRKERVILEEQARRAVKLREIASRFKGQK